MALHQLFTQKIDESIDMMGRVFKNFEKADEEDEDRFVSVLISNPGVGKSSVVRKYAGEHGYDLIDLNLACIEPTDIIGLGAREKVNGTWETVPALPSWAERAFKGKCIIFVDEFNNTTQDTLAGFQKMFSDFVINGQPLPRSTHIIGACNPPGDDALFAAKRLSGAFRRRLCMIPVIDDYDYVSAKHGIVIKPGFVRPVDLSDIADYMSYEKLSSALVDNICLIHSYDNLSDYEKLTLTAGFGTGALDFARNMEFFSAETFASGHAVRVEGNDVDYSDWTREPDDVVSEYQQTLWVQRRIGGSVSYSKSKAFAMRIENPVVYDYAIQLLKDKFDVDWETDETKPPEHK